MARDLIDEESQVPDVQDVQPLGIPPRKSLADLHADVQQRLGATSFGQEPQNDTSGLDDLANKLASFGKVPPKEHTWSGTGKAFMAGAGELGAQAAGAGEYVANRLWGQDPSLNPVGSAFNTARTAAQSYAQSEVAKLTPQEQDEMAREWTTLDPHRTIWQGGPSEFVHTVALHAAEAAPATMATLWPAARLIKAGMTAGALTYVGATQAGLSMGQIANNISDDIMKSDENTLRQNSPKYAQLIDSGMDPQTARQQLVAEAQKYAPVVGGLVSGGIATVAGRFLTPVLSKEGASLGARLAGGAADQAIQGGGSAGADYIARETAAHTYDNRRAPDLTGAGKAALEGAATGALQGAGFAAVSGHGKVGRPTQPELGNNQQNPGEAHEQMPTDTHTSGPGTSPTEGGFSQDNPLQQRLPLVDRNDPNEIRHQGELGLEQTAAQSPAPIHLGANGQMEMQFSEPPPEQRGLDLQAPAQGDLLANGVPADQAAAIQARRPTSGYQGAGPGIAGPEREPGWGMQEPNGPQENLDLRGGQMNPPRPGPTPPVASGPAQLNLQLRQRQRGGASTPPVAEVPTVADQLRQRAADQQSALQPDVNQPDLFRDQGKQPLSLPNNRPMPRGEPEASSTLVPFDELRQQLADLQDPSHPRQGMYLDAANLEQLRRNNLLDPLRDKLVNGEQTLPNFDRKGGALITDSPETAQEAIQLRDNKVATPEEIIQHLSHDQLDTSPAATLQRAAKVGTEAEVAQRLKAQEESQRAVSRATESNITGDDVLAQRANRAASRDRATGEESPPISADEAAGRLTAEARRVHNEARARTWPGTGVIDPSDLVFASPAAERQYRELHNEFLGTQVMRRSTVHPQDAEKGRVGQEITERRIQTFLKTHAHETKAEQVARAAVKVSPEGVRGYLAENRDERVEPHQTFNPEVLEPGERPTRADVHEMSDADLHRVYDDVVERSTASPRAKLTKNQILLEDDGVRSKMEKRINRYYRSQESHEELGHAKSEGMATTPRRALTEREERVNASKMGTKAKRLVGYKTLEPEALMSTVESQREMERARTMSPEEQRAERVQQYKDLDAAIKRGEGHLEEILPLKRNDLRSGDSPLMGQKYLREILQYGRALKAQNLRSPEARAAAKKFTTLIDALGNKKPAKRAQYLIDTFKTELQRQGKSAARADPDAPARVQQILDEPHQDELDLERDPTYETAELRGIVEEDSDEHERRMMNTPYRLAHDAEVARRRREDGLPTADPDPINFNPRMLDHLAEVSRRQKEDEEFRSSLGYPQKPTAVNEAARAVADHLEDGIPHLAHEILPDVIRNLPEGSPLHTLFSNLRRVIDSNTVIGYAGRRAFSSELTRGHTEWQPQGPVIRINRDALEDIRAHGQRPEFAMMHVLGHELTHVATTRAIEANPFVKARLTAILDAVRRAPGADKYYGSRTNEVHEMVAEAYSNEKFQKFLDSVKINNDSLWSRFKRVVAEVLGFKGGQEYYSALDAIMREHGTIFRGRQYATTPGEIRRLGLQNLEGDREAPHVGNMVDRAMKSVHIDRQTVNDLVADKGGQFQLSAMTPRQQLAQYGHFFKQADGSNPYKRYWDTFFARSADNARSMQQVNKISGAWTKNEVRFGNDTARSVTKLMNDATLYKFHPDVSIKDPLNAHLTSPEQIERQKAGAAVYDKLPPEWQEHYQTVKKYYADEQRNSTDQIVLNALHAMLTKGDDAALSPKQFDAKYDAAAVRSLKLDTHDGLQKEFGDKLSGASQDMLAKIGQISDNEGPYFPLMRNGNYVVTAERNLGSKEFDQSKDAQAYLAAQRAKDPTYSVWLRKTDDGTYHVSTVEKDVRMAESLSEARQHEQNMRDQYGKENVKPVQLKADLYKGEGSITTGSALDNIMRKLEGNPAAQTAIKDFYLRSLGEQSFRKRELHRSNRRGADEYNQHRSFVQYGRSQSYYLSQLKYGRHLANAQGAVQEAVQAHRDESEVSTVRMGQFARELALRDEISRSPYKVSELVQKGTRLTQFMMLTSPSHWFVRGAQPYMLTAPWLAARHGLSASVGALGRAQRMIAAPLVRESADSALGFRALLPGARGREVADKSFSVIDQVLDHIRSSGTPDAEKIATLVQRLRDNNLIDLSMATELSDIGKGLSPNYAHNVLNFSRIGLHLIEVNNRVMTGIAARELALKQGLSEEEAYEHAADAINVTHNDYSYGNTPRLFMAQQGLIGGARPLMTQFMKYPQQVYGQMISSALSALKGKTPQERAIGVKSLAGYLATHMLAAGAVGASIQPIKWAFGALMAGASAIGATDEPYTVANALSGDTYDNMLRGVTNDLFGTEMGELAAKGLPSALGIDLSQRMALGNMYSFHLRTDSDASTIGSLVETFGGPWISQLETMYNAGAKFLNGDIIGGVEGMSPHLIRDLVKAGDMTQRGVVDNRGETLIPSEQLTPGQIFAQALGFRPDQIAETLDRNAAEKNEMYNIRDQQKALVAKYAGAEPTDRDAIRDEVREFNTKHPGFAIQASALIKAAAQRQQDNLQIQKYGVRTRAKQLPELSQAGAPYNVQ